jgi:hypothetical protein
MAGTGKSTISRTIAQTFADKGQLGASFFFKRGEGDRGGASKFWTTITAQLVLRVPPLIPHVRKAIDDNPAISGKSMREQFEKLIYQPLSKMEHNPTQISTQVLVVDALDECEQEGQEIKTILHLASQTRHLRSVDMRIFLTSRPDLPVRLGFEKISADAHQDVVLQDIRQDTIEHDISAFLKDEFAKIRDDYNCSCPSDSSLPLNWPGERIVQALAKMASPLFIFAATVCRFVGDRRWNPEEQLVTVLKHQTASQESKLDGMYLSVLDQLLVDLTDSQKQRLAREFREVVGSIVILADPLSTSSLAKLLGVSKRIVDCRLDSLHSVLSVPTNQDSPIRLLHLSFRDFLLDPEKRKSLFWVDVRKAHELLADSCIGLLSAKLKRDICNLQAPGILAEEISDQKIKSGLSADLQYACQYWVLHLKGSEAQLKDDDKVHKFLRQNLLYWLETLSLIGKTSEGVYAIILLESMVRVSHTLENSGLRLTRLR